MVTFFHTVFAYRRRSPCFERLYRKHLCTIGTRSISIKALEFGGVVV